MLISGWPNFAPSPATMMSSVIASSHPPPSAQPLTAAITGLVTFRIRSHWPMRFVMSMSIGVASAISPMSAPAAKARSLPVTTIARTPSSRSSSSSASHSASMTAPLSAFSCFGRLRRTSAVRWSACRSTSTSCVVGHRHGLPRIRQPGSAQAAELVGCRQSGRPTGRARAPLAGLQPSQRRRSAACASRGRPPPPRGSHRPSEWTASQSRACSTVWDHTRSRHQLSWVFV